MNVYSKVAGGTIRASGPGSDGMTAMQRRRFQEKHGQKARNAAGNGYNVLVCNTPGRFHGGVPSNQLTRTQERLTARRMYARGVLRS